MSLSENFGASGKDFDWSPFPSKENGKHWSANLKSRIVAAIQDGSITKEDVQNRYKDLSDEELDGWINRGSRFGKAGLMVTKTQMYREPQQV